MSSAHYSHVKHLIFVYIVNGHAHEISVYYNYRKANGAAPNKPQADGRHTGEKPLERSIHSRRRPAPIAGTTQDFKEVQQ